MAGKTSVDALRVDEVYNLTASLLEEMAKGMFEKDTAKQEELKNTFEKETIPKYLGFFEKKLSETDTSYFVASMLTLADLAVHDITYTLLKKNPKVLDDYPEIRKMRQNVEANARIKAHLESRPDVEV